MNILGIQHHDLLYIIDKYNDGNRFGSVAAFIFRHCQRMQKLYKVVKKEEEERTIRLAQTLTVPKNKCSYRTKPITIIVLVNNIQQVMMLYT